MKKTLLERAEEVAKEKGVKIPNNIKIGLKAIQRCHDLSKKCKGSPCIIYESRAFRLIS